MVQQACGQAGKNSMLSSACLSMGQLDILRRFCPALESLCREPCKYLPASHHHRLQLAFRQLPARLSVKAAHALGPFCSEPHRLAAISYIPDPSFKP